jgi:hypothetical protein
VLLAFGKALKDVDGLANPILISYLLADQFGLFSNGRI